MYNDFEYNKDLSHLTTFGLPAKARIFAEYKTPEELTRISRTPEFTDNEVLHIGGGSNLLFLKDFDGLVLHSAIKGIKFYKKDGETVFVIGGAGENWAKFVDWTISHDFAGLENLAGIPGEVGASAVQNVGAYGVEAGNLIHAVECFDVISRKTVTFRAEECQFAYRNSRFKTDWKGRYYVLRVCFRLKNSNMAEHLDYGPLKHLKAETSGSPTTRQVADEIIRIRNQKLPDPAKIGSAGSFFKNPVVTQYFYTNRLLPSYPDMPAYPVDDIRVKLPAGWLIEHAGLKGEKTGGAQVYDKQCLVIVNTGNASGRDVERLAAHVQDTVKRKFNVLITPEVNYIDSTIKVTVLGSGTSRGVPEMCCDCNVCTSEDKRDKRTRASIYVETNGVHLLIDASPDLRSQAIDNRIESVDAVLLTHEHYDHVGGIDDLRPFSAHKNLPMFASARVVENLKKRLDYCFRENPYPGVPRFELHTIGDTPFMVNGVKIIPIEVMHGKMPILGYRIGDFAYITDCKTLPEESKEKLTGVKTLIINALRPIPHFAHLSFEEARELIEELKPEQVYLTHFCHEAGLHDEIDAAFNANIHPAYDGQKITVN